VYIQNKQTDSFKTLFSETIIFLYENKSRFCKNGYYICYGQIISTLYGDTIGHLSGMDVQERLFIGYGCARAFICRVWMCKSVYLSGMDVQERLMPVKVSSQSPPMVCYVSS